MIETMNIEALVDRIIHGLPKGLTGFKGELQQHIKPIIQSALDRAGLVTRDAFDAQLHVLHQTRVQVEALQKQIEELNAE